MINGWYCRSMASDQGEQDYNVIKSETSEEEAMPVPENFMRYKNLKRKLKFLIYENEFLADTLRTSQHKFLKVAKDRSFLLDRLLQYEKPDMSSSESNDDTDSSDDDVPANKKKKMDSVPVVQNPSYRHAMPLIKRKRIIQKKPVVHSQVRQTSVSTATAARTNPEVGHDNVRGTVSQNIMTTEEVERHLQSRQSLIELRAPPTVPTEMFEPSLDSEGDQLIETSPSNLTEDCISMDMGMMQD